MSDNHHSSQYCFLRLNAWFKYVHICAHSIIRMFLYLVNNQTEQSIFDVYHDRQYIED